MANYAIPDRARCDVAGEAQNRSYPGRVSRDSAGLRVSATFLDADPGPIHLAARKVPFFFHAAAVFARDVVVSDLHDVSAKVVRFQERAGSSGS